MNHEPAGHSPGHEPAQIEHSESKDGPDQEGGAPARGRRKDSAAKRGDQAQRAQGRADPEAAVDRQVDVEPRRREGIISWIAD